MLPGSAHESRRDGALPRRIAKRVYFPTLRDLVTKMRRTVPGRMRRSNERSLTDRPFMMNVIFARGHDRRPPRQSTVTRDPAGARTVNRLTRTAPLTIRPRNRTMGNGLSSDRERLEERRAKGCAALEEPVTPGCAAPEESSTIT